MVNYKSIKLSPGLYFVSTPIGTARDITLRALDILANADVLAAEDTRTLKKLLEIHSIQLKKRSLISYHDHNASKVRPKLLAYLSQGKSIAYASEAGTPLIADPGFSLLTEVLSLEENYNLKKWGRDKEAKDKLLDKKKYFNEIIKLNQLLKTERL